MTHSLASSARRPSPDAYAAGTYFNQLVTLWELAEAQPSTSLSLQSIGKSALFFSALQRLLHTAHIRWDRGPDGRSRGTFIDTMPERRLRNLISWAEEIKSEPLLGLTETMVEKLLPQWRSQISNNAVVYVLKELDSASWVLSRGGTELRRKILDAVLTDLYSDDHRTWKAMLDYKKTCALWTENDEKSLMEEFHEYRSHGFADELEQCESRAELQGLLEGLSQIQKEHRLSFRRAIKQLKREIVKRGPDPDDDDSEYHSPPITPTKTDILNESEIRLLFDTLID